MTLDAQAAPARIYSLDILRGLMALAVVVYHTSLWTGLFAPAGNTTTMLAKLGIYGVQGFFVISGFVMVLTTRNHRSPGVNRSCSYAA